MNIISKKCANCGLFIVVSKPHLCAYCSPHTSKSQRTKEFVVRQVLEEEKIDFTHNKSTGVCGNFRPDFLIDCHTHFVVVECDEDQHRHYDTDCENTRMCNIQQSLGIYTCFIRYNPDTYKEHGNTIRVSKQERHRVLLEAIQTAMSQPRDKTMDVVYLYYDK